MCLALVCRSWPWEAVLLGTFRPATCFALCHMRTGPAESTMQQTMCLALVCRRWPREASLLGTFRPATWFAVCHMRTGPAKSLKESYYVSGVQALAMRGLVAGKLLRFVTCGRVLLGH